jgi:tetratricopeptide (TPR) repeat protein
MDGWANVYASKRLDTAAERLDLAVEINPNDSLAWLLKGVVHAFMDQGGTAATAAERALCLSPLDPRRSYYLSMAATAELAAGNYGRVIDHAKSSLRTNCLHASTLRSLAVAQWLSGDGGEARHTVAKLVNLEHDAAAYVVLDKDVELVKAAIAQEFRRSPVWLADLPLDCEISVGETYG